MWIDDYCKLCMIYSRSKDLILLRHHDKLSKMLMKLAEILDKEKSRSKAFVETFNYIKFLTGSEDPYLNVKRTLREIGRKVAEEARKYLENVNWDIKEAIRLSAAANIIDTHVLGYENIKSLEEALWDKPVIEDEFRLKKDSEIYVVIDNAGEAEIDKLLVKSLIIHGYKPKIVVREKAYEIDETIDTFEKEDLEIITTPGNMPPIMYIDRGYVIAKGIANVEAYIEMGKTGSQHLFRAKCDVIAKKLNVPKNSVLILSGETIKKIFL